MTERERDRAREREPIIVKYFIDRTLRSNVRRIEKAMEDIEEYSRVKFEEMDYDDGQSLLITSGDGCYFSPHDCIRNRPRTCRPTVSIGEGCTSHGTMLHELMHAIGFEHEHQRPDRDDYLKINWGNIDIDEKDQFEKLEEDEYGFDVSDFEFDYSSVMLYGEYDFSRNREKTMEARSGRPLKDHNQLSRRDKEKLNAL